MKTISHTHYYNLLRKELKEAQKIVSSRSYACEKAREIYGKRSAGMWKSLIADAKAYLELVRIHGITAEKPLIFKKVNGKIQGWGAFSLMSGRKDLALYNNPEKYFKQEEREGVEGLTPIIGIFN